MLPCLVGTLCLSALSATAGVTVSLKADAPTTDVIASFVPATPYAGYQWRNDLDNGLRDLGHSFFAEEDAVLKSFGLLLYGNYQVGTRNADVTINIWEMTAAGNTPTSAGSELVSTQSVTMPVLTGGKDMYIDFAVDDVDLAGGKYYLFMLSFDDPAASRNLVFASRSGSGYPSGNPVTGMMVDDKLVYTNMGSLEMAFYVTATSQIPEPSAALWLTPLAVAGVLLVRRRRCKRA